MNLKLSKISFVISAAIKAMASTVCARVSNVLVTAANYVVGDLNNLNNELSNENMPVRVRVAKKAWQPVRIDANAQYRKAAPGNLRRGRRII